MGSFPPTCVPPCATSLFSGTIPVPLHSTQSIEAAPVPLQPLQRSALRFCALSIFPEAGVTDAVPAVSPSIVIHPDPLHGAQAPVIRPVPLQFGQFPRFEGTGLPTGPQPTSNTMTKPTITPEVIRRTMFFAPSAELVNREKEVTPDRGGRKKKGANQGRSPSPRNGAQQNSTWQRPLRGAEPSTASVDTRALRPRVAVFGEAVT